jgi:hypothetical protein
MSREKIILLLLCSFAYSLVSGQNNDIDLIKSKLREVTLFYTDRNVKDEVSQLSEIFTDGKFTDLDYTDNSAARWKWGVHWQRLTTLDVASKQPESGFYQSESIRNKIVAGVEICNLYI